MDPRGTSFWNILGAVTLGLLVFQWEAQASHFFGFEGVPSTTGFCQWGPGNYCNGGSASSNSGGMAVCSGSGTVNLWGWGYTIPGFGGDPQDCAADHNMYGSTVTSVTPGSDYQGCSLQVRPQTVTECRSGYGWSECTTNTYDTYCTPPSYWGGGECTTIYKCGGPVGIAAVHPPPPGYAGDSWLNWPGGGSFVCPQGSYAYAFYGQGGQNIRNDPTHLQIRGVYCVNFPDSSLDLGGTRHIGYRIGDGQGGNYMCDPDEFIRGFSYSGAQADGLNYSYLTGQYCGRMANNYVGGTYYMDLSGYWGSGGTFRFGAGQANFASANEMMWAGVNNWSYMGPGGARGPRLYVTGITARQFSPYAARLTANPMTINYGQTTTLTWNAMGGFTSCRGISPAGSSGAAVFDTGNRISGSVVVTPDQVPSATYQVECDGPKGRRTASVTITVIATVTLTANPTPFIIGVSPALSLTWSAPGASDCASSGATSMAWSTGGATSGTSPVSPLPSAPTVYTVSCNFPSGPPLTRSVTVGVSPCDPAAGIGAVNINLKLRESGVTRNVAVVPSTNPFAASFPLKISKGGQVYSVVVTGNNDNAGLKTRIQIGGAPKRICPAP